MEAALRLPPNIVVDMFSWTDGAWRASDRTRTRQERAYLYRNVVPGDHALLIRKRRYLISGGTKDSVVIPPIVLA